jgi:hypothetical protein
MAEPLILDAPGLAKIAAQVAAILRSDAALRAIQGANAQQAKYFDQPGVFSTVGSVAVTGAVVYRIVEMDRANVTPALLVLVFDTASGAGRYRVDGPDPSPTVGVAVPAGGVVLQIPGIDNIKNFRLTAEAGQTLTFARYLFI